MSDIDVMRDALNSIAEIATKAAAQLGSRRKDAVRVAADVPGCAVKQLPKRLILKAAKHAVAMSPQNAPMSAPFAGGGVIDPMQIAVLTAKYWGPTPRKLSVSFLDGASAACRRLILEHMNAWSNSACITFEATTGTGDVRIARERTGYWSYLGTDIKLVPTDRATMNLQEFTEDTPLSEYKRVVRHETGHTLGFPHEHMRQQLVARIDPNKAYKYFLANQGWDKSMVDAQVLTSLDDASIMGTPSDETSIMCYQLPASITKDGEPIIGGVDINSNDYRFASQIYPRQGMTSSATFGSSSSSANGDDWPASEDV